METRRTLRLRGFPASVYRLPMRDGNFRSGDSRGNSWEVYRLPMRDGNSEQYEKAVREEYGFIDYL